ncbi:MAG: nucleotidyltransferase family protein [Saprospiraceae bacterium]|nr:nucleotidyltransferase family protein [Saprospiraceae bacterium]MCB9319153.1 nucleotidyltransferase family protein [Lewinellaceae bacterium]
MTTRAISAIILAAGTGTRMKSNKPLSLLHGKPLISYCLSLMDEIPVQERILVVGHQAELLYPLVSGKPYWTIYNHDYQQGIGGSIAAGIQVASPDTSGYMIVLADMPLLQREPLTAMVDKFFQADDSVWIMRPVYEGEPGHPVLFHSRMRPLLSKLRGTQGAKEIIGNHTDHVRLIPWPDASCLVDVDTQEDISRLNE